jgi:hypothetical protein
MLKSNFQQRLHRHRLDLHPFISLDRYFALGEASFDSDLPYIQKIHQYLQEHQLPDKAAAASERSFALVGDEKWVTEHNNFSQWGSIQPITRFPADLSVGYETGIFQDRQMLRNRSTTQLKMNR